MVSSVIPSTRHLQYARGYIALGMVDQASDKLEAIGWDDRMKPEVLAMRCRRNSVLRGLKPI
jgi:hypothetical protein